MNRVDFNYLLHDSRARVYLLWAGITGAGYTATHFYQDKNINFVWFGLALIGFIYMYRVMPLRVKQMRNIYLSWLVPIAAGIGASIVSARGWAFVELVQYLGVFWLVISAVGYFWNGLFDAPSLWYFVAAAVNIAAGIVCYLYEPILISQYLFAAVISVWSMLMLWVFRADSL